MTPSQLQQKLLRFQQGLPMDPSPPQPVPQQPSHHQPPPAMTTQPPLSDSAGPAGHGGTSSNGFMNQPPALTTAVPAVSPPQGVRAMPPSEEQNDGGAVCVRNMPMHASYRDVRDLFRGIFVGQSSIKMIHDDRGRRTGTAYVNFRSMYDRLKGLERSGSYIRAAQVTVTPLDGAEFAAAIDAYRPEMGGRRNSSDSSRGDQFGGPAKEERPQEPRKGLLDHPSAGPPAAGGGPAPDQAAHGGDPASQDLAMARRSLAMRATGLLDRPPPDFDPRGEQKQPPPFGDRQSAEFGRGPPQSQDDRQKEFPYGGEREQHARTGQERDFPGQGGHNSTENEYSMGRSGPGRMTGEDQMYPEYPGGPRGAMRSLMDRPDPMARGGPALGRRPPRMDNPEAMGRPGAMDRPDMFKSQNDPLGRSDSMDRTDKMGRPDGPMDRMGRPIGLMDRMGRPDGSMDRMGRPDSLMDRMGRPDDSMDRMGRPDGPMGRMGRPDGPMGLGAGPMGRGGSLLGRDDGSAGRDGSPMDLEEDQMTDHDGGFTGRDSGGPMGRDGGPMGRDGGPMGRGGVFMGRDGGFMGRDGSGPMGRDDGWDAMEASWDAIAVLWAAVAVRRDAMEDSWVVAVALWVAVEAQWVATEAHWVATGARWVATEPQRVATEAQWVAMGAS